MARLRVHAAGILLGIGIIPWTCAGPAATGKPASPADPPAVEELSSRLVLAPEDEPGERLTISGALRDAAGAALANTRLRAFQTDRAGYYARGPDGRELGSHHARLSGWFRTDAHGRFRIETILPGGYPSGRTPIHVHFKVDHPGLDDRELTVYFEQDPRLTPAARRDLDRPRHFFVSLEESGPGAWRCRLDLRLPAG